MFNKFHNFIDCCLEALSSLRQNLLRTSLTVLGIVIGVMSVIVMLAVGKGVQTQVTDTISSIGSNLLVVWPKMQSSNRVKMPGTGSVSLTLDDAAELKYLDESFTRRHANAANSPWAFIFCLTVNRVPATQLTGSSLTVMDSNH